MGADENAHRVHDAGCDVARKAPPPGEIPFF